MPRDLSEELSSPSQTTAVIKIVSLAGGGEAQVNRALVANTLRISVDLFFDCIKFC